MDCEHGWNPLLHNGDPCKICVLRERRKAQKAEIARLTAANAALKTKAEYCEERIQAALRWAGAKHIGGGVWQRVDGEKFMVLGCTNDPWEGAQKLKGEE
jgi:hypothetical protein